MSNSIRFLLLLGIMAGVTYLVRMVPMVLVRRKIQNPFLISFLYYVPYAVLAAMTVPAAFSSTGSIIPSCVGVGVGVILAYFRQNLITVALSAAGVAFITEQIILLL